MLMFAKLKKVLQSSFHQQTPEQKQHNLHLAAVSMLLEVVDADEELSIEEARMLPQVIQSSLGLSQHECDGLINEAKANKASATSLFEFTSIVNQQCSLEQRQHLVLAMWKLAYADGHLCQFEDQIIRRSADLLHLRHSELIQLRNKAIEQQQ